MQRLQNTVGRQFGIVQMGLDVTLHLSEYRRAHRRTGVAGKTRLPAESRRQQLNHSAKGLIRFDLTYSKIPSSRATIFPSARMRRHDCLVDSTRAPSPISRLRQVVRQVPSR